MIILTVGSSLLGSGWTKPICVPSGPLNLLVDGACSLRRSRIGSGVALSRVAFRGFLLRLHSRLMSPPRFIRVRPGTFFEFETQIFTVPTLTTLAEVYPVPILDTGAACLFLLSVPWPLLGTVSASLFRCRTTAGYVHLYCHYSLNHRYRARGPLRIFIGVLRTTNNVFFLFLINHN